MQNNQDKLINVFCNALEIDKSQVSEELTYQGIPEWDSISHMMLINEMESAFTIEIQPEHILEINSFGKAKTILSQYDISFQTA